MESVEVQVLAEGDNGKSHCLVMPSSPDANKNKLFVKTAHSGLDFDDASTARTEVSTEIDDMSALREKLSFGSLYLSDGGTFHSQEGSCSFDASRIARVRSKQGDLLSISESSGVPIEHKCLMDLDDDDDCSESDTKAGIKTTLEKKLSSASRVDFHGNGDHSHFATAGDFVGNTLQSESRDEFYGGVSRSNFASPSSIFGNTLHTESRAEFYGGYSRSNFSPGSIAGNTLRNSESRAKIYGGGGRSNFASTGSMFADGTLNTASRVGFYRESSSDSEEPLSCRQKLDQPALTCDENLFETKEWKQKREKSSSEEDRSGSIFSAVTCCFAPTQP